MMVPSETPFVQRICISHLGSTSHPTLTMKHLWLCRICGQVLSDHIGPISYSPSMANLLSVVCTHPMSARVKMKVYELPESAGCTTWKSGITPLIPKHRRYSDTESVELQQHIRQQE